MWKLYHTNHHISSTKKTLKETEIVHYLARLDVMERLHLTEAPSEWTAQWWMHIVDYHYGGLKMECMLMNMNVKLSWSTAQRFSSHSGSQPRSRWWLEITTMIQSCQMAWWCFPTRNTWSWSHMMSQNSMPMIVGRHSGFIRVRGLSQFIRVRGAPWWCQISVHQTLAG